MPSIETDALIIGAGPVGLFQAFELGLLGISAHIVDALPSAGGQCIELYPDKPIYDIPGIVATSGRQLVASLLAQLTPFKIPFHLHQQVDTLERQANGRFLVKTSAEKTFLAKIIVIAAGVGAFQPKKLTVEGLDTYLGTQLFYHLAIDDSVIAKFAGKHTLVVGGDDAAVDAAIALAQSQAETESSKVTLLYRRDVFNVEAEKLEALQSLSSMGKLQLKVGQITGLHTDSATANGLLTAVQVTNVEGQVASLPLDTLLVYQGISPKLGPISNWGLAMDRKQLAVDTEKFQTSEAGIFAVGDINTYPGKKKLILCGFHEAALASFAAAALVLPDTPTLLQYTTTSTLLHQRLGVAHP